MLGELGSWASSAHRVDRWEAVPTLGPADGRWELCACQSQPALSGLLAVENTSRRERQERDPVPRALRVSPESTNTDGDAGKNPAQVLGSLVLALGFLGIGRCSAQPVAFTREKNISKFQRGEEA